MSNSSIEFPFEHPAAAEANAIFLTLGVYSDEDYRNLPRRDRYVWDVGWFEAEVMNGGVDQYFHNSAGDHAEGCLEALKAIGAEQSCELLKKAFDLFPEGKPSSDRETRHIQMEKISDIDELVRGRIEVDLYQRLLDYYRKCGPNSQ